MASERGGQPRRRLAAPGRDRKVATAVTAALLVAAALALFLADSGGDATAGSSPTGGGTGTVERRTLAEHLTATGTIGYAGDRTVLARLAGTVTALPSIGDVIRRGEPLYALADEPVPLLYGTVPAYRALAEGTSEGKDVEQLERNLAALGYEPGSVDEEFTSATAAAVAAWQEDLGLQASGEIELGRVAFLPGPQRVTGLEAMLGEALGAGDGEAESGAESASVPVLRTSSTRRIVAVELEADQQSIARREQKVEAVLPGGAEVPGRVQGLAAVQLPGGGSQSEEGEPGVEVTVSLTGKHRIPALDGAAVSVLFTQQVRRHVLSVPLTALVAIGSERFAVVAIEGTQRRRIAVTPGLAADGYVEVKGRGLREGMRVETGE